MREITSEVVNTFLNGHDPMEHIIDIECAFDEDTVSIIYVDDKGIKRIRKDDFKPEGYDEYEAMIEDPSVETISALHFGCNGGKLDVRTVTDSFEEVGATFEVYKKGVQRNWKLVSAIEESVSEMKALEKEWKALIDGTADTDKLQYFVK